MLEALAQLIIVAILLFLLLPRILPGTSVAKLSKKYGEYWAVDKVKLIENSDLQNSSVCWHDEYTTTKRDSQ